MRVRRWVMLMTSIALAACSGGTPQGGGSYTTIGGSAGSGSGGSGAGGSDSGGSGGAFYADPAAESLSIADVQAVIARAAAQAQADGKPAVIAVVDRVGNVLALYRMTGAPANAHISDAPNGQNIDVQGLDVPAVAAALAKAITGAYLSSGGNAFSSRTGEHDRGSRISRPRPRRSGWRAARCSACSSASCPARDLAARFGGSASGPLIGPKRSPLGLSADPGGFPLYKNGVVVGGVGVLADGVYGADLNVLDKDRDADERIALAERSASRRPRRSAATISMSTAPSCAIRTRSMPTWRPACFRPIMPLRAAR